MAKQKVDEILKQLEDGVSELFESDKYKNYLNTMSKFHRYSVSNCMLIAMQKPEASYVAGYTAWRDKFHRQVLKGEKGITIIAPSPYRKLVDVNVVDTDGKQVIDTNGNPVVEEKEIVYQAFRTATVFDVSQTAGEPLPTIVSDLMDPVQGYDDYVDAITELSPVPVRFDNIDGSAKGYFSPQKQEIVVQRGMPEEQTIKTLLHEVSHARLGHGGEDDHFDRHAHEVQAESVAYCCCSALGLDTSEYSFGYIAGWSSGKDVKELKQSLDIIRKQADLMITSIEQKITQTMELRMEGITGETLDVKMNGMKMGM